MSQLFESFPLAKRARQSPTSRSHEKGKFSPKAPKTCCWLINSNVFPFIQIRVFTQAVQFFLLRAGGRFFCLTTCNVWSASNISFDVKRRKANSAFGSQSLFSNKKTRKDDKDKSAGECKSLRIETKSIVKLNYF